METEKSKNYLEEFVTCRVKVEKMLIEEEAVMEYLRLSAAEAGSFCAAVQGVVPSAL